MVYKFRMKSLNVLIVTRVFSIEPVLMFCRHLSELCVDERTAVRKSACQTLFSTISAHGVLLQKDTWKGVLWQVSHVMYNNLFVLG